jgi:stage V sporulation protein AC
MEREEKLRQKLAARERLLESWFQMNEKAKNLIQQEMLLDHQKITAWEAKVKGEKKKALNKLRVSIEKQQKAFQRIDSLEYKKKVVHLAPKPTLVKNVMLAFIFGGLICTVGQLITNLFMSNGLVDKDAGTATAAVLIFAGAFFTGIGVYDDLGKYAGAGSIIPITGFANSIAASALEAKREGYIYGVGARLFFVAGPVIVYGTVVSILIGLIHFLMK